MTTDKKQMDFDFNTDDLLEFPRDLGETGMFKFKSEQRNAIRSLEKKFGIVLNRRVRLRLLNQSEELAGKLTIDSLLPPQASQDGLRLRLGNMTFKHTEIASCELVN